MAADNLTDQEIEKFCKQGFLVKRGVLDKVTLTKMQEAARESLKERLPPFELESAVGYPGAVNKGEQGEDTIRRLKGAYQRGGCWGAWCESEFLINSVCQLFGASRVILSQAHHNCLMTKSPEFSSDTGWHQDIRYWSFNRPELINAWLALSEETPERGGLKVIPGSHRMSFSKDRFDEALFFREVLEENLYLIQNAVNLDLMPGDMVFFHSRLLHCASRNYSDNIKYSLVFTYRECDNLPISGSRSASMQEVTFEKR